MHARGNQLLAWTLALSQGPEAQASALTEIMREGWQLPSLHSMLESAITDLRRASDVAIIWDASVLLRGADQIDSCVHLAEQHKHKIIVSTLVYCELRKFSVNHQNAKISLAKLSDGVARGQMTKDCDICNVSDILETPVSTNLLKLCQRLGTAYPLVYLVTADQELALLAQASRVRAYLAMIPTHSTDIGQILLGEKRHIPRICTQSAAEVTEAPVTRASAPEFNAQQTYTSIDQFQESTFLKPGDRLKRVLKRLEDLSGTILTADYTNSDGGVQLIIFAGEGMLGVYYKPSVFEVEEEAVNDILLKKPFLTDEPAVVKETSVEPTPPAAPSVASVSASQTLPSLPTTWGVLPSTVDVVSSSGLVKANMFAIKNLLQHFCAIHGCVPLYYDSEYAKRFVSSVEVPDFGVFLSTSCYSTKVKAQKSAAAVAVQELYKRCKETIPKSFLL